jgi:hypothetical protein
MGLLDLNEKIDAVINAEYFNNNGWSEYHNFALNVVKGYIPTKSWMKVHFVEVTTWNNKTDKVVFWVRYDEYNNTLYNLRTGEKFTTTDVLTLEMLISNWKQSIQNSGSNFYPF